MLLVMSSYLPKESTWSLLALCLIVLSQASSEHDDSGLRGPGMVWVSEGDIARLVWQYDPSLGAFSSVYIYKAQPERVLLLEKNNTEEHVHDSRVRLIGADSGIALSYARLADTGTYEIELTLNFNNTLIHLNGTATLEVKRQIMWLARPGNVYACQKDAARLIWEYDPQMGSMNSAVFYKLPQRELLLTLVDGKVGYQLSERLTQAEGNTSGLTIQDSSPQDSGQYEIEVKIKADSMDFTIYDEAHIDIFSRCPIKESYTKPPISYGSGNGTVMINNNKVMVNKPVNLTLLVVIPAADPPVTCVMNADMSRVNCTGGSDGLTECALAVSVASTGTQSVNVTLFHKALAPSTNVILVIYEDSAETMTWLIVLIVIVVVVLVVIIAVVVWRKVTAGPKQKEYKAAAQEEL